MGKEAPKGGGGAFSKGAVSTKEFQICFVNKKQQQQQQTTKTKQKNPDQPPPKQNKIK